MFIGMMLSGLVCFQVGHISLKMMPLGNRPFPSKMWGRGRSAETLVPLETICWKSQSVTRLSVLQAFPAGSREREGWWCG